MMRELQKEIIETLQVSPSIEPGIEVRDRVHFLKAYLKRYPFIKSLVLGISGGQDSTLAGKLAQMAISEMREETGDTSYQFIAIRLPYGKQNDEDDANKALAFIQADKEYVVNIKPAVDQLVAELKDNSNLPIGDFNKGNMKARQRMIVQYAVAGEFNGAVLGTDHGAEAVTGFYTKFGDLEENKPMIADEVALGVTYEAIDDYLEGKEVTKEAAETIENWYLKTMHKRHLPITQYDTFWK
jgi:NAD+ synthase